MEMTHCQDTITEEMENRQEEYKLPPPTREEVKHVRCGGTK